MPSSNARALEVIRPPTHASDATAARFLDVVVAAAALVLFAPLMVFVAVAIFVEGGRPIFFSQIRLGRRGRRFRIHKFRKFRERRNLTKFRDAERSAGRSVTLENDPRMTRVGSLLARSKLDELPQLWNVLKGDMSIVGPRPETLNFQDCFKEPYGAVLDHKPGIFGPSQVLFRNEGSLYRGRSDPEQFYRDVIFPLKARIDLAYFPHRTLCWDVAWMVRGALAVFGWSSLVREGAALIGEAEDWIREGDACDRGLPAPILLLTRVGRWGIVEIARDGHHRGSASTGGAAPWA